MKFGNQITRNFFVMPGRWRVSLCLVMLQNIIKFGRGVHIVQLNRPCVDHGASLMSYINYPCLNSLLKIIVLPENKRCIRGTCPGILYRFGNKTTLCRGTNFACQRRKVCNIEIEFKPHVCYGLNFIF